MQHEREMEKTSWNKCPLLRAEVDDPDFRCLIYLSHLGLEGQESMSREETGMSLPRVPRAATSLGARMHRVLSRRNRQLPVAPLCNAPIISGKEQRKLLVAQYASVRFTSTWNSYRSRMPLPQTDNSKGKPGPNSGCPCSL